MKVTLPAGSEISNNPLGWSVRRLALSSEDVDLRRAQPCCCGPVCRSSRCQSCQVCPQYSEPFFLTATCRLSTWLVLLWQTSAEAVGQVSLTKFSCDCSVRLAGIQHPDTCKSWGLGGLPAIDLVSTALAQLCPGMLICGSRTSCRRHDSTCWFMARHVCEFSFTPNSKLSSSTLQLFAKPAEQECQLGTSCDRALGMLVLAASLRSFIS